MNSHIIGVVPESILEKAEAGGAISESEIVRLLEIVEDKEREALFAAARRVRDRHSGNKVFLYGFIYLSTYCRNDCQFCFYRASNSHSVRYRKNRDQIVEAAKMLAESNVHVIDLTMGEDPAYFDDAGFKELAGVVTSVRAATDLPVMISPGMVEEPILTKLKESGVSWYACYQETYDRSLFATIRPDQDFDSRLNTKKTARRLGLLTEEGMLSGLGESYADVARTLVAMGELETDQVRVMGFVPQNGTPLYDSPPADPGEELKIIAIMRLLFPDRLIPASLDIVGLGGLKERLNAGANVITSLVPPGEGLAGVAQSSLDIDDSRRTVASVEPVLQECNLAPATKAEYCLWVENRLEKIGGGRAGERTPGQHRQMLVAIAGGALQGLEITYLAKMAGYETLLLDRNRDAPATGICDSFVAIDLTDRDALIGALGSVDLVIPATENVDALNSLVEWCERNRKPLAFDPDAYAVSSSKTDSDALFRKLGIPAPAPWPDCAFPVLAKPDGESGSKEVEVFLDLPALEARFDKIPPSGRVLQEYVFGPSFSIEVIGRPEDYTPLQIVDLEMDRDYDCKRVLAPTSIPSDLTDQFKSVAVTLAEAVRLTGIMDVEVILHEGQLKVLEIDARFPSQTPIAVYHSTGINMVERLSAIFLDQNNDTVDWAPTLPMQGSVLEHIRVRDGHLTVCGEHIMVADGPLRIEKNFFGAGEALTSFTSEKDEWVATLMVRGSDLKDARDRRDKVIAEIQTRFDLSTYSDEYPETQFRQPR